MDQESAISVDRDQEPFSIGEFRPEDAEGIVRLFLEIYGEGYPIRLFYDPKAIITANRDGEYLSIVARTDSGKVIGVNHLFHSAPFQGLYETGVGLVSKQYRNPAQTKKKLTAAIDTIVPANPHMEDFRQPVCNHVFMQKTVESLGSRKRHRSGPYARRVPSTGRKTRGRAGCNHEYNSSVLWSMPHVFFCRDRMRPF
jgi:hypothetical protein